MDSTVLSRLVDAYVERHAKQFQWDRDLVLREQDTNFWAFEEFDRLVRRQPEDAWEAVLAVLAATTDEYTLSNLAAGPLEDLINQHGEAFIDRIETLARCEPRFQELLCGVWRGSTPENLAPRCSGARDKVTRMTPNFSLNADAIRRPLRGRAS